MNLVWIYINLLNNIAIIHEKRWWKIEKKREDDVEVSGMAKIYHNLLNTRQNPMLELSAAFADTYIRIRYTENGAIILIFLS